MVVQWLENNGACEQSVLSPQKKKKKRGNEECLLWEQKLIVLSLSLTLFTYTCTPLYVMEKIFGLF